MLPLGEAPQGALAVAGDGGQGLVDLVGHVGAELAELREAPGLLELASLLIEPVTGLEQSPLAAVEQMLQQQVVAAE
ncbi:hypothetical protein D3C79_932120 [compost metagenome]